VIATLLDFDGVLVDSEPVHLAAFNDVLAPRGIVVGEAEYVERYLSLDDAGVFRAVLSREGYTPRDDEVRALVASKEPCFMSRFAGSFRAFPGAAALVERRARRGLVGIVSGALEREIVFALERIGVRPHVAFIVSADRTVRSKPDPEPFLLALEELRRAGHEGAAVVVEDSVGGVAAARAAGLRCVAVSHSYPASVLLGAGAEAVADNLARLTDALLDGTRTRASSERQLPTDHDHEGGLTLDPRIAD
jgi:beta-phosphoglucomutase-like phosphatase (HAD superfamily)